MREAAQKRGLKVSEWGIEDEETGEVRRMADEREVYAALGYAWIPPELREHAGELEAARKDELPELLEVGDLRGDLHTHTVASDGHQTVEQMADGRARAGLRVPRDHRPRLGRRHGHGPRRGHRRAVRRSTSARSRGSSRRAAWRCSRASRSNIMPDGDLDLPDEVLAELDWVVASVHGARGQTARRSPRGWWRRPSTRTSTSSATRPGACSTGARPTTSTSRR